jgi:hypothetical protein
MRNDARPIGEAVRDDRDADRRESNTGESAIGRAGSEGNQRAARQSRKGFITDRDPGDEEALPASDATLKTKI